MWCCWYYSIGKWKESSWEANSLTKQALWTAKLADRGSVQHREVQTCVTFWCWENPRCPSLLYLQILAWGRSMLPFFAPFGNFRTGKIHATICKFVLFGVGEIHATILCSICQHVHFGVWKIHTTILFVCQERWVSDVLLLLTHTMPPQTHTYA